MMDMSDGVATTYLSHSSDDEFREAVNDDLFGKASEATRAALRGPFLDRWDNCLAAMETEIIDKLKEVSDPERRRRLKRAQRGVHQARIESKFLVKQRNIARAEEQQALAQQKKQKLRNSTEKSRLRTAAYRAAAARLRKAHDEEYQEYLNEELLKAGITLPTDAGAPSQDALLRRVTLLKDQREQMGERLGERLKDAAADLWRDGMENIRELSRLTGMARGTLYTALRERGIEPTDRSADE